MKLINVSIVIGSILILITGSIHLISANIEISRNKMENRGIAIVCGKIENLTTNEYTTHFFTINTRICERVKWDQYSIFALAHLFSGWQCDFSPVKYFKGILTKSFILGVFKIPYSSIQKLHSKNSKAIYGIIGKIFNLTIDEIYYNFTTTNVFRFSYNNENGWSYVLFHNWDPLYLGLKKTDFKGYISNNFIMGTYPYQI